MRNTFSLLKSKIAMAVTIAMMFSALPSLPALAASSLDSATIWGGAQWVWDQNTTSANIWSDFRRDFTLASVPAAAELKIAADTKYWMWVNGVEAVWEGELTRGPNGPTTGDISGNDLSTTYYDTVDIAKYLKPGQNNICIDVWYWGKNAGHDNCVKAGLLVSSDILDTASGKVIMTGDGEWWAEPAPTMSANSLGSGGLLAVPNYQYDAGKETPWRDAGYSCQNAGSPWVKAVNIAAAGAAPWNALFARPTPM